MKHAVLPSFAARVATILLLLATGSASRAYAGEQTLPLPYAMQSQEQRSQLNPDTFWKCVYPIFSGSPAADAINNTLVFAVAGVDPSKPHGPVSLPGAAGSFIGEYDSYRKDDPEAMGWYSDTTGKVLLNRAGLLTVSITTDIYTGGAHGMNSTSYYVFDAETGQRLSIGDIFLPGSEARLDALVDRRYREMKGLGPNTPLNGEQGELFEDVIRHNDNFAVTDLGITFLYNPYEIAAYATGPIEVDLKWAEVQPLLRP